MLSSPLRGPALNLSDMLGVKEIIIVSSSVESPLLAYDLHSGTQVAQFKNISAPPNGLCAVGRDYVAAAHAAQTSGGIFFWLWNKSNNPVKCLTPEPIVSLTASGDGVYMAGGGKSGRIYVWEVSSGRVHSWVGHYRSVTALAFSHDDSLLITGSADTAVNVWPMIRMMDRSCVGGGSADPMYKWMGHQLSVSGVFVGSGGSSAVVASCSADHTCKIWSMALGVMLRSIVFPVAVHSVALDPGEYTLYAGGADGNIYLTDLNQGAEPTAQNDDVLEGHKNAITGLAFSLDGLTLVSSSEDSTCRVWDSASRACMRTISHPKGPITGVLVVPRPPNLGVSSTTDKEIKAAAKKGPAIPVTSLKKYEEGEGEGQGGNYWEGPPVVLPSYLREEGGGGEGFRGGVQEGARNLPSCCQSEVALARFVADMEEVKNTAALQETVRERRDELGRALNVGVEWQKKFKEAYDTAEECLKFVSEQKPKKQKTSRFNNSSQERTCE